LPIHFRLVHISSVNYLLATSSQHYYARRLSCGRSLSFFFLIMQPPPRCTLFPYTTLFRSQFRPCPEACRAAKRAAANIGATKPRSEEHTSELQSQSNHVCRLLLEKKKIQFSIDRVGSSSTCSYSSTTIRHILASATISWSA